MVTSSVIGRTVFLVSSLILSGAACGPSQEFIAFVQTSSGDDSIYIMHSDGTGATRITDCLIGECYPTWSPDGTKILYQKQLNGAAIYVINADGTNDTRLSPSGSQDVRPSWSPDASKIVYTHVVSTGGSIPITAINVMNADGTNVQNILPDNGTFNIEPRWSPDGSKIVFMSGLNGGQQIYTMTPTGTGVTQITNLGNNGDPMWSPDGKRISFGSDREGGGKLNVYTMSPNGSNVVQLTHFLPPDEAGDTSWSPDGTQIVFEHDVGGSGQSNPNVPADVWIMNSDGTASATTHQSCASVGCAPRWKPHL